MFKGLVMVAAGAAAMALASSASAMALHFDYSESGGTNDFSYNQDSAPTPANYSTNLDTSITITNFNSATLPDPSQIDYFNGNFYTGGLFAGPSVSAVGPQIYTGPESAPMFRPGKYNLYNIDDSTSAVLRVTGVPEPSTWAFMLLGLGTLGAALRRRNAVRTA